MSPATSPPPAHLLIYPFPSSGHIIPLLDLADRLLRRGVSVTALVTPKNEHLLQPLLSSHPSLFHPLVLPAPIDPSLSDNLLICIVQSMRIHHSPAIVDWFKSHPSPPIAILSDFFLGWTRDFASELRIQRLVFSPSAAFSLSVDLSLWHNLPACFNTDHDNNFPVTLTDVPNSPTFPWRQLSHFYRMYVERKRPSDLEFHRESMLSNTTSWGVVFNTFKELEPAYVGYMKEKFGEGRVWAVGPLLPPAEDSAGPVNRGGNSSVPSDAVLTWLDSQAENSVVYICFGSRMALRNSQMAALAAALELSRVHFIWCAREPTNTEVDPADRYGELPEGFEERAAGRGLVIRGWAPQVLILRHRAVGAFLTHCGWNSVLEGISAGAVMLTWPMGADQYTDATLLVEQLGVGIRACEGDDAVPDPAELAKALAESVDEARPEKGRAKKLSEAAAAAVRSGGSSDRDLDAFVESLAELERGRRESDGGAAAAGAPIKDR